MNYTGIYLMQIYIIDDHEAVASLHAKAVANLGYGDAQIFTDPKQALPLLTDPNGPTLALLDLNMPGIDGDAILLVLDQSPESDKLQVIIVSGEADDDSKNAARLDYKTVAALIKKPASPAALKEALDAAAANFRA